MRTIYCLHRKFKKQSKRRMMEIQNLSAWLISRMPSTTGNALIIWRSIISQNISMLTMTALSQSASSSEKSPMPDNKPIPMDRHHLDAAAISLICPTNQFPTFRPNPKKATDDKENDEIIIHIYVILLKTVLQ